jgi:hypothetical protein
MDPDPNSLVRGAEPDLYQNFTDPQHWLPLYSINLCGKGWRESLSNMGITTVYLE